ncbi:MAG: hypothetical protein HFE75_00560 [Firmicutes bacterium]|jgi:hypothetical protein|nr:hypothetical protein [Bacillota bacterium]NBI62332.1 hypothetical protein [Clostridiales bacterium]
MKRNEEDQCRKAGSGQTNKAQSHQVDKALDEMGSSMEQELGNLAMEQDLDFDQRLEKMIARKMRKIAIRTAVIVVLIIAVIFLGISPMMNLCYSNPIQMNVVDENKENDLCSVLDAYYQTTSPYVGIWGAEVKREGFSRYTLNLNLTNCGKSAEATLEMKRGRLSIINDSSQCMGVILGRFYEEDTHDSLAEEQNGKELVEEMKKLPESAYLYLALSDKKPRDVSALLDQTNDDLELQWIQVYQPENEFQAGIGTCPGIIGPDRGFTPEELTAERLKEEYLKNLKLLKDNQDVWKGLELYSENSVWSESENDQLLQQAISAAEKSQTFQTKNYCISGTKKEVLAFLEKGAYHRIYVDDVMFSILK